LHFFGPERLHFFGKVTPCQLCLKCVRPGSDKTWFPKVGCVSFAQVLSPKALHESAHRLMGLKNDEGLLLFLYRADVTRLEQHQLVM
jgi:hypothetical protein